MSQRRKVGDWVWLPKYAGFMNGADRLKAQIQDDGNMPCMLDCGDPACNEWATLWSAPDPQDDNKQHMLCHVSECEMQDEQWKEEVD